MPRLLSIALHSSPWPVHGRHCPRSSTVHTSWCWKKPSHPGRADVVSPPSLATLVVINLYPPSSLPPFCLMIQCPTHLKPAQPNPTLLSIPIQPPYRTSENLYPDKISVKPPIHTARLLEGSRGSRPTPRLIRPAWLSGRACH